MIDKIKNIYWKQHLGYDWKDNIFTGIIVALISMYIGYSIQYRVFGLHMLRDFNSSIMPSVAKLSILSILPACLIFNFFDKLYSFKGALIVLAISAVMFVVKYVF